ncbi:MAG: serine/threonine protein kinase, partial [Planctomycetales bacterium]
IGAGGMGQVFLAEHGRLDRLAAIKVLSSKAINSPTALKRFQQEVKAAAKLAHANIVSTYDASEQDGVHYLVMEYVKGADLSHHVRKTGPLTAAKAVHCMLHAAEGLAHAHEIGIIHRDIKPSNILLTEEDEVKILDMGLARLDAHDEQASLDEDLTQDGQVIGTIAYMSPEQAKSTKNVDHRTDIYSLGCTLHFLLTGRPPYQGDTTVEKLIAHREDPIPSLREACDDVSPALDDVFQRMMGKSPDDRQQSMRQLIWELTEGSSLEV